MSISIEWPRLSPIQLQYSLPRRPPAAASYPLYLLHQEIGYRVYDAWDGQFWVMFPTILLVISVASHLIASNIEAPFAAWVKARKHPPVDC